MSMSSPKPEQEEEEEESMLSAIPRRRSSDLHHPLPAPSSTLLPTTLPTSNKSTGFFPISPTFILLLFLTIWSLSTLLSSSFHICISSRKLDLYCISGGVNHHPPPPPPPPPLANNIKLLDNVTNAQADVDNAYNIVRDQVRLIRSWTSGDKHSCDGRGIFVYDLPSKFNKDLLAKCDDLLPWSDLCDYFRNDGKGQAMPKLGNGWVHDPDAAKLFYVPFYGGLDILRWNFKNVSTNVKDSLGGKLVRWLKTQGTWWRNGGRDHMFVLGKIAWDFRRRGEGSWGSNFLLLEEMRSPYKFLIERQPWEANDIGIPHPTHFHPRNDGDVADWQARIANSERKSLVTFAGAARPEQAENIRSLLIKNCVANSDQCRYIKIRF